MRIYKLPARDVQPADARARAEANRARAEANAAWLGWLAARAATTPRDIPGVGSALYVSELDLIQRAVRQARRAIGWRRVLEGERATVMLESRTNTAGITFPSETGRGF